MVEEANDSHKTISKRKVAVTMEIKAAHVSVTQVQVLKVTWARSNKSLVTKGQSVDSQSRTAIFKDKFSCDANLRYKEDEQMWLPDLNEITLECGDR